MTRASAVAATEATTMTDQESQDPAPGPEAPPQPLDEPQARRDERARERLGRAEAEVARLRDRLAQVHRGQVEQAASRVLQDPRDLWAAGVGLDELLTGDGELDQEAVKSAVERVVSDRPHWRRQARMPDAGNHVSGQGPAAPQRDWSDVLKPRRR